MEFTFDLGLWGLIALIVGSVFFGVGVQLWGNPHVGYEWLVGHSLEELSPAEMQRRFTALFTADTAS